MNDKERMRGFKIFRDFTPEDLESILQIACQCDYGAGDVILEDSVSESSYDLFIVLKGLVKVEIDLIQSEPPQKSSKKLAVLKHGAVLGEIGLLRGVGRSARVLAYSDVTVLRLDQKKLIGHLEANPHLGYIFMRNLAFILAERLLEINFMWRDTI